MARDTRENARKRRTRNKEEKRKHQVLPAMSQASSDTPKERKEQRKEGDLESSGRHETHLDPAMACYGHLRHSRPRSRPIGWLPLPAGYSRPMNESDRIRRHQ